MGSSAAARHLLPGGEGGMIPSPSGSDFSGVVPLTFLDTAPLKHRLVFKRHVKLNMAVAVFACSIPFAFDPWQTLNFRIIVKH